MGRDTCDNLLGLGPDVLAVVMAVEEKFDIIIPDEEAEKILNMGQLYDYVFARVPRGQGRSVSRALPSTVCGERSEKCAACHANRFDHKPASKSHPPQRPCAVLARTPVPVCRNAPSSLAGPRG